MILKKFTSAFLLSAVLSVFSCSSLFLWSEFSTHVLAQNEICAEEKHCLTECLMCEVSHKVVTLDKATTDKEDAVQSLTSSFTPEIPSKSGLIFEIPSKNIVWASPRPPNTHSFAYYGPHTIVKNVVIIV